jgi:hypothetical protein
MWCINAVLGDSVLHVKLARLILCFSGDISQMLQVAFDDLA